MRILAALLVALVAVGASVDATSPTADPVEYRADLAHSAVRFKVRHLGISWVNGRFRQFQSTFVWDEDDPASSWVTATIDAATIDTEHERRDAHLRSEDFLWVESHPTLTFASTKVERVDDDELKVTGNLSIRGVTRPVVLDVTLEGRTVNRGRPVTAWTARTSIDRKAYGLVWNRAVEAGGWVVGDEVRIEIEVEAYGPEPAVS